MRLLRVIGAYLIFYKSQNFMNEEIISATEACALLGIARRTLDRKISKRQVPSIKVPNSNKVVFSKKDLIEWLKSGSRPTKVIAQ